MSFQCVKKYEDSYDKYVLVNCTQNLGHKIGGAVFLFMRVFNKWHSIIKKELKKLDITQPQFVVLTSLAYLLQKEDEVTQIMLSKISGIDVMTISQIINLLEKNGFIERKQHSKDTRANSVFLTLKGQNILKKAVPLVENIDDNFFNILAEKEQLFRELLKKL